MSDKRSQRSDSGPIKIGSKYFSRSWPYDYFATRYYMNIIWVLSGQCLGIVGKCAEAADTCYFIPFANFLVNWCCFVETVWRSVPLPCGQHMPMLYLTLSFFIRHKVTRPSFNIFKDFICVFGHNVDLLFFQISQLKISYWKPFSIPYIVLRVFKHWHFS